MPKETAPPFRQVDPAQRTEAYQFDDMSSIHQSIVDVDEEQSSRDNNQTNPDNTSALRNDNHSDNVGLVAHQRAVRRKNLCVILTLLVFLGIVAAIGAAVVIAMQNRPAGGDGNETSQAMADESATADKAEETPSSNSESNNTSFDIFDTSSEQSSEQLLDLDLDFEEIPSNSFTSLTPSSSPTICIPLELGIVFDENANMTKWKLVKGGDGKTDNEIVWQSDSYDAATYDTKAVTVRNCLPPFMYTFVFTDPNGARSYVLSSEGEVIVTGLSLDTKQDIVAFELPFEAPEAIDSNGDGLEDRLGTLMPYDSSGLEEGVDCEPFRLELQTDDSGVETLWGLYEGDSTGKLIADGGPYASNSNYVYEYCLKSPSTYSFYIYDWGELKLFAFFGTL